MIERRIVLPIPTIEGSNSRAHWCVRQRAAKGDRFLAAVEARLHGLVGLISNPIVTVEWYAKTRRLLDCDNALSRCKSYIDGLTDAGWWEDDKDIREMTIRVYMPGEGAGYTGKVVITAREGVGLPKIDSDTRKGRRTTRRDLIDPEQS